jgi:hypothetical protein
MRKSATRYCPILFLLTVASCLAQTAGSGKPETRGSCSPAVTGDNNTFIFRYCGTDPEEGKRILRLLKAVAQGETLANGKLDEVLEILNKPTKLIVINNSALAGTKEHRQATIRFYTEDPVDRGQFEVECDRACIPVKACPLLGGNALRFAVVKAQPNMVEFLFQRQFPSLTQCDLTVESRDNMPIKILGIASSNRVTDLDFNVPQPNNCIVATGGVMC